VELDTAGVEVGTEIDLDWSALDLRLDDRWITEAGRYLVEVGLHAHDPDAVTVTLDRPGSDGPAAG
jgi:hypothetical protein